MFIYGFGCPSDLFVTTALPTGMSHGCPGRDNGANPFKGKTTVICRDTDYTEGSLRMEKVLKWLSCILQVIMEVCYDVSKDKTFLRTNKTKKTEVMQKSKSLFPCHFYSKFFFFFWFSFFKLFF